jgi:hypothetical protein
MPDVQPTSVPSRTGRWLRGLSWKASRQAAEVFSAVWPLVCSLTLAKCSKGRRAQESGCMTVQVCVEQRWTVHLSPQQKDMEVNQIEHLVEHGELKAGLARPRLTKCFSQHSWY